VVVIILRHPLRPASVSYYRYPVLLDLAVIRSLRCLVARQPVQPYTPILTPSHDAACSSCTFPGLSCPYSSNESECEWNLGTRELWGCHEREGLRTLCFGKQVPMFRRNTLPQNSGTVQEDRCIAKAGSTLVTLPRNVTPYRDSVEGTRDRVTYQKLVTRPRDQVTNFWYVTRSRAPFTLSRYGVTLQVWTQLKTCSSVVTLSKH